jgi:type IX secretion system PorP/SprF family membrane protein
MKLRLIIISALSLGALAPLSGQQIGHYSLYMFNRMYWNPAYAGLDQSLSFTGGFRRQWAGVLEGSPTSQNLTVHMPLYMVNGGIGISLDNDAIGASRVTSAMMAYNYQLPMGRGLLSLGLSAGVAQFTIDGDLLRTPEGSYIEPGVILHNDDILPIGRESALAPTFDAGLYYQSEWLEFSLSAKNITQSVASATTLDYTLSRTFFGMLGLNLDVGRAISVHPSFFVRSDLAQTQTDATLRVKYNNNIMGGVSFRGYSVSSRDALALIFGFKLSEKASFAYAYDLTLSDLSAVSNGSHEIMLHYNLNRPIGKGRLPNVIYNPRSL